jgi:FkbM family methyltransferase
MKMSLAATTKKIGRLCRLVASVITHPLHREHKIKALTRWVRLALANRLTPTHQITIPYVAGAVLHWPAPSTSVVICARYGLGEYEDMVFLLHLLRPGDLFCDVGANAGVYTVLAGRGVGCNVVAMEPVPKTFDLLMQNVYANGISNNVEARNIGIGNGQSRLHFTSSLWSYNHVVETADSGTVDVDVLSLDDALAGRTPTAIKIDVEGFEAQVVSGAKRTLAHPALKALVIEMWGEHLSRYNDTPEQILTILRDSGLSGPFWYDPKQRQLTSPGKQAKRRYNQIWIRDLNQVLDRTRNSPPYEIHGTHV